MTGIVCFHNPDEENGYLSNWYPSHFVVDRVGFSSMEQYMMYRKACCFNDAETAAQILETDDVAEIKRLGRRVAQRQGKRRFAPRQEHHLRGPHGETQPRRLRPQATAPLQAVHSTITPKTMR